MRIVDLLNRLTAGLRFCLGCSRARPFILSCHKLIFSLDKCCDCSRDGVALLYAATQGSPAFEYIHVAVREYFQMMFQQKWPSRGESFVDTSIYDWCFHLPQNVHIDLRAFEEHRRGPGDRCEKHP
jgi:hypothetical protein